MGHTLDLRSETRSLSNIFLLHCHNVTIQSILLTATAKPYKLGKPAPKWVLFSTIYFNQCFIRNFFHMRFTFSYTCAMRSRNATVNWNHRQTRLQINNWLVFIWIKTLKNKKRSHRFVSFRPTHRYWLIVQSKLSIDYVFDYINFFLKSHFYCSLCKINYILFFS